MLRTLNEIRQVKDPLKQYMVEFDITELPTLKVIGITSKLIQGIGSLGKGSKTASAKDFKFRAQSFTYPGTKIAQTELTINGFTRKSGCQQNKSGVWKCTVVDDYDGSVSDFIQGWCDCIHCTELGIKLPLIAYSTTCSVTVNKPGGGNGRRFSLRGFYPIEYSVSQINTSSSDPVTLDVSFNYDFFSGTQKGF